MFTIFFGFVGTKSALPKGVPKCFYLKILIALLSIDLFVDGKRTKISIETTDKKESEKFLKSFVPQP